MHSILYFFTFSTIFVNSQYYNPSLYTSGLTSGLTSGRTQTILVPVYSPSVSGYGMGGYGGYGMMPSGYGMSGYPGGMYGMAYPGYGGGSACCGGGGGMSSGPESNAKKFLRGATDGFLMGSLGMLTGKK